MKEKIRAKNLVSQTFTGTYSAIVTAYDAFKTANPSVVIVETGPLLALDTSVYRPVTYNNTLRTHSLSGYGTMADLRTAYETWRTANSFYVVLRTQVTVDNTAGAINYAMFIEYRDGSGDTGSSYIMIAWYYMNDDVSQP